MKAEDLKKHFETSGRNVVFVFEDNVLVRDEIRAFDLGPDTEIGEYLGDAFAMKCRIRMLGAGKRLVVLVPDTSPLTPGRRAADFPLLGELMSNGECVVESPLAFMAAHGMDTSDAKLVDVMTRHLAEMTTEKARPVFDGRFGPGFTVETAALGLAGLHLGMGEMPDWRDLFARLFVFDAEAVKAPAKKSKSGFLSDPAYSDVTAVICRECDRQFGAEGSSPKGADIGVKGFFSVPAQRFKYNTIVRPLSLSPDDPYSSLKETDALRLDRMDAFLRWAAGLPEKRRKQFFTALDELSAQVNEEKIVSVYGAASGYGFYSRRLSAAVLGRLSEEGFGSACEEKAEAAGRVAMSPVIGEDAAALARTVAAMAGFYQERSRIVTFALNTPGDFLEAYTGGWWRLDRMYRLALENFAAVKGDSWRAKLEAAKDAFETDAQETFNEMNLAWTDLFSGGSVPGGIAQEDFYAETSDPSVKMAFVVSDALRYEVALEVMDRLNAERGAVTMKAGIAALPSETKYTKALLLPHSSSEFRCGEAIRLDGGKPTATTAEKEAVLKAHCADGVCVTADGLKEMSQSEKREIFKHKVVYVFHDTIDDEGHGAATGQDVAVICRRAVEELVALVRNIQNSCNVNNVWLVADHGFLIGDRSVPDSEKIVVDESESPLEKTTRYYFTRNAAPIHGIVKLKLQDGSFIAMPAGTRRFKSAGSYTFVHGGASLQEVIIPMMHSRLLGTDATHRREKVGVTILGADLKVQSSRLKFTLLQNDAVSAEVQGQTVKCALYDDSGAVSDEVSVKLDCTSALPEERTKSVELVLNGTASGLLTLKVYSETDSLNAMAEKKVTNNTLVEQDDW